MRERAIMAYFIALLFIVPFIALLKAMRDAKLARHSGLDWRL